jgi:hypothetical protein
MRSGCDIARRRLIARLDLLVVLTIMMVGVPALGFGQWFHYPTEGLPRKADGKPDLAAPTPRLPDGKPDFSGIWHAGNRGGCPPEAAKFIDCGTEIGGSRLTLNLGLDLPGGTLPYQPWAAELVKQRSADDSRDDPHVRCLPDNPPRAWTLPHLTRIVQVPKYMALLYEVNAMYRQIFIDGRPQPKDPNPAWNGYSTAHWEGDTLVVHTEGFRDNLWIDMHGSPMSDAAKMTERMRRPNYGTLEIALTIDDPKTYTRPFTVNLVQLIEPDTELVDEFCLEGEKSYERMLRSRGK